jgi:hypothetical protein
MESLHRMNTPQPSDQSVLLDYVSPDPVTIIITSLQNHHWRVAWHTFVACTCQISPIPAGHVFTRGRQGLTRATMVNPPNIYVSLGIMVAYCIALPFARLPSGYRTPRPLRTMFDLALLCYDSELPCLPEFEVQHETDREEHLKAKVVLAKRDYQFGLYLGKDGRRHLGISPLRVTYGDISVAAVDRIVVDSEWHRFANRWFRPPRVEHVIQPDSARISGPANNSPANSISSDTFGTGTERDKLPNNQISQTQVTLAPVAAVEAASSSRDHVQTATKSHEPASPAGIMRKKTDDLGQRAPSSS